MFKFIATTITTIICLGIAVIPETIMYFIYSLISPQTVLEKILVLGIFWIGGLGVCFLFAFLAFTIWVALIDSIAKS